MKIIKLGEIARIDISNVDKKTKEHETPVILCNFVDVYYNWAITTSMVPKLMVATANSNQIERFSIHKGQVAITKDSETRDDIGVPTYIADDIPHAVLGYHCALITPNENVLNGKYLNALMHSAYAKKYFAANASGSGQRYTLTNDIIAGFPVLLPDLQTQEQIGDIFSNIDRKIEINTAINAELEDMAKTMYDYWFLQFEFPDENGKPYKSSGGKMVYNEELKREIPEGWSVATLKGKYEIKKGISYTSDEIKSGQGTPMINLASVDRNRNYQSEELKYYNGKISKDCILHSGDLLIACTDLTRNADIVGSPILVPDDDKNYTYSMDMAKLIVSTPELDEKYLYTTLRTEFYHNYIKRWASGTNVLHLNLDGLDWYTIWFPPIELQKKYGEIVTKIHKRKSQIIKENQELASLRDFLLPLLMNGQVGFKEKQ